MDNMDLSGEILSEVSDVLAMSEQTEKREPVSCVIEHALLPEHLADYVDQHGKLQSTQKADQKDLQTLRAQHHGVARLLAENVPEGVVAEMTGFTAAHISNLKNTPSMIELISFYRGPKNDAAKVIGEKLRVVGDMSLELLHDKLRSEGVALSVSDLTAAAKLGFDRSGHGPQSTVHNIEEHRLFASEELLEIAQEARRREMKRIVEPEEVRRLLPPKEQSNGERTDTSPETGSDSAGSPDHDNDSTGDDAI